MRARDRPDLRLVLPGMSAWGVDVALQWGAAPTGVVLGIAGAGLLVALGLLRWRRQRQAPVPGRHRESGGSRGRSARRWLPPPPSGPLSRQLALTAAAIALTSVCLWGQGSIRSAGTLDGLATAQAIVTVEAVADGDPVLVRPRPGRRVDTREVVLTLRVESVRGRGSASEVSAPVLLVGDVTWLDVRWQERVQVTGRLSPAEPGEAVVAVLRPLGGPTLLAEPPPVVRWATSVRERLRSATSGLPPDAAGLVPGLVLGDTSVAAPDLTDAMTVAGLTHLSAVSGSNVSVILAAALGVCRLAGVRRRWRPWVAAAALCAFVVLARPEPSVVRAAVMGAVGLAGLGTSRRRVGTAALSAAVIALLCWDPWLARSYGFALSVLATLGLLLLARPWGAWIGRRLPARLRRWGPALAVPAAAQAACAPVIVLLQGSVSLVAVPANLLADPLVAPATIAGVLTSVVAVVWEAPARLLAWGAGLPAIGICWVARAAASMPWATLAWPHGPPGALLLGALTVAGVLSGPWLLHQALRRPLAAAAVALIVVSAGMPARDVAWPMTGWAAVACGVGQGDALVLASGPGHAVLVDVGPDPAAVDGCLRRVGVSALDAVLLTHFHADHVEGLPGALHGRRAGAILVSPVAEPAYESDQVRQWAAAAGLSVSELAVGDRLSWGPVQARVWWPARELHQGSVPNNASVVLTVSVAGLDLVLLGDIEREAARAVLGELRADREFTGWRVDVVKVAHHGSANRDDDLLDLLEAPVAIVCVGLDNDYGHPAPSTLAALAARGYRVLRTDLDGDVAVARRDDGAVLVAVRGP